MSNRLLYDDVLALISQPKNNEIYNPQTATQLKDAVIFKIDNIAEYFFMSNQNDWDVEEDAPNLAPPFETFWMEWILPKTVTVEGEVRTMPHNAAGLRMALYFRVVPHKDELIAKWQMAVNLFAEHRRGVIAKPTLEWRILVTKDGKIARRDKDTLWLEIHQLEESEKYFIGKTKEQQIDALTLLLWPGYLALSFLHCKNVEMIENVPPRLPLTKKRAQHPPRVKYYTLNIKPMQRILEDEGQANKTGLKLALHICRGHFKDFSKGSGLFGKFKGLYWWDSQVRGKRKYGEVVKNYQIQTSQKEKAK